jgi:hypothetical protein
MKSAILLAIIFASSIIPCLAQKNADESSPIETVKPFDAKNYKDWQEIKLFNKFSFYIPPSLKKKEFKGIHGVDYDFIDENLSLNIDTDLAAGYPTFEKQYPSYWEKYVWIDGAFAWIWSFEHDGVYKYETSVLFQFKNNNRDDLFGMYLFSKDKDIKEMAEKIFKSVQFKDKSKEKETTKKPT